MRLAFQDGQVHVPMSFMPNVYVPGRGIAHGVGRIGDDSEDKPYDPASTVQAAITGAGTALMLGGSTKADVVGGIQAGILAAAPFTGPAAPFVAAIGALIGPVAAMFKGCGATCTQTTEIANSVQTATAQILQQYWAQPVRTVTMQQATIQALQQLYSYLIQNCQKIGGQGGQQCVADRQPGGKYDYQAQNIVQIQNDTGVVADPVEAGSASAVLSSIPTPLLLAGAGLLLFMFMGGK